MAYKKRRVTLVQDETATANWKYDQNWNAKLKIPLYDTFDDKFKLPLTEMSGEDENTRNMLVVIIQALNGQSITEFHSSWSGLRDSYRIWTRFSFDNAFLQALSKVLIEPTIRVESTLSSNRAPYYTEVGVVDMNTSQEHDTVAVETFTRKDFTQIGIDLIAYPVVIETLGLRCTLQNMFIRKTLVDCSILTSNKTEIKCHGCVLATNSDVFHAMLTCGLQESQTKQIQMTDLPDDVVNAMLSYLYGWEIGNLEMTDGLAFNLLCTAHKYNITALERAMLKVILDKSDDCFEMNTAVVMYFFAANIDQFSELCEKALNVLKRNKKNLTTSSAYQDLLQTSPKEATLLAKLLKL